MGYTWTVYAWQKIEEGGNCDYQYIQIYAGESRRAAMQAARQAKNDGCGCVKIEWR